MEKDEESVYDEESREEQVEADEISPEEEGFMQGYEKAEEDEDLSEDEE